MADNGELASAIQAIAESTTRLEHDMSDVKRSLVKIVLLEERLVNTKEAQARMGNHIDRIEEAQAVQRREVFSEIKSVRSDARSAFEKLLARIDEVKAEMAGIDKTTSRTTERLAIIGAGIAMVISIVLPLLLKGMGK